MTAQATNPELTRRAGWAASLALLLAAIGMLGPAQESAAQPRPRPPVPKVEAEPVEKIDPAQLGPALDAIVQDLGSNDFALRQSASERLANNDQFPLEMLEAALKRPGLTLEARSRLVAVARQRFFRSPRAALGFQFGGQLRDRIVVGKTFERFPSFKLLEEGDMIVGADGYKLEGPAARNLLQSIIVSHDPGETMTLVVRRGAQKIELEVPLGKFSDLEAGGAFLPEDRLARAWRVRAQARGASVAEPIVVEGAPKMPWGPGEDAVARRAQALMQQANESSVQLVGGGMPRGAHVADDPRFEQFFRPQVMIIQGRAQVVQMPAFRGDWDQESGMVPLKPQDELVQLREAEEMYQKRMGDADPDTVQPGDSRRADLRELKKTLESIRKQKDAIEAEIDEARAAKPAKQSAADANPKAAP